MIPELNLIKLTFDDPLPGVVKITFSQPKKLNALSANLIGELDMAVNVIEMKRMDIKAVVFTGEGKAFIAGADISEMVAMNAVEARHYLHSMQQTLNRIESLPMPTVALINGFALGGGLETSLACDIRIATSNAKVGLPEVGLGIIPAAGGTQRLTRLVGEGVAKYMILTGEIIDAEKALKYNIVSKVFEPENKDDELLKLLKVLLKKAPLALKFAKESIGNALNESLRSGLELELNKGVECFLTDDLREGMNAFLEKREANFKGK